jgi:hypothetical protein
MEHISHRPAGKLGSSGDVIWGVDQKPRNSASDFCRCEAVRKQKDCHDKPSILGPVKKMKCNVPSRFTVLFPESYCHFPLSLAKRVHAFSQELTKTGHGFFVRI